MVTVLSAPRGGLPQLLATPSQLRRAERLLARGHGPIAIDTERAGSFRYNDRAFLLQLRRAGTGTVLIDPEPHREVVGAALGGVMGSAPWVLHAASTDLPALLHLGLHTDQLFDTAIAAHLLNITPFRLADLCEQLLGVRMPAAHAREDWSRRPLPKSWLEYAALDVELLLPLAEVCEEKLRAEGKLEWAQQEFQHALHSAVSLDARDFASTKLARGLRRPSELAIARSLWIRREHIAQTIDVTPHRVLPDAAIMAIARTQPTSAAQLSRLDQYPRELGRQAGQWLQSARLGLNQQPWPKPVAVVKTPTMADWKQRQPETYPLLERLEQQREALHIELDVHPDTIITRKDLRSVAWRVLHQGIGVDEALNDLDVRPWQREVLAPITSEL